MTEELELSVMAHGPTIESDMRSLLENFEQEHHVQVILTILPWDTGWAELVKYALYAMGPDVSEIGSTWMPSLVGMDSLKPASTAEIAHMGGEQAFLHPMWQSAFIEKQLYGVPWFADTRLIYYRRDLFARAGLDPAQVFQSTKGLSAAVEALKNVSPATPWMVPTIKSTQNMHIAAPWVWGAGGDFLGPDGRTVLIGQPEALYGFCDYFKLGRYLGEQALGVSDVQAGFYHDKAAMVVSGSWMGFKGISQYALDVVKENYGIAAPPGVPFVGGSHLVAWKHSKKPELARKLVEYLAYSDVQRGFYKTAFMFPTRNDVLQSDLESGDEMWKTSVQALYRGRCFPSVRLWGKLEETVSTGLGNIWSEITANPRQSANQIVFKHISVLAERLKITFGG
ncbi:MAG: extracellular solute-binding protein [Anaerolineales bacterium]